MTPAELAEKLAEIEANHARGESCAKTYANNNNPADHCYTVGYGETIQADISTLIKAVRERDWQPIETAPKDGTVVAVWVPSFYRGKGGAVTAISRDGGWFAIPSSFKVEPTLWMPIPEPLTPNGME